MDQKIIYITFQSSTNDQSIIDRVNLAQKSVDEENLLYNNWVIHRNLNLKRDATAIGDVVLPFIRDMIESGMDIADNDDIVVISNADICIIPEITKKIIKLCNTFGALYSHRYDFEVLNNLLKDEQELNNGKKYLGCDFFAFLKNWWIKNENIFPDMVLGREVWDMIYRRAIKDLGGIELDKATYHQIHQSPWSTYPNLAGNAYNLNLSYKWLLKHGGNLNEKQ